MRAGNREIFQQDRRNSLVKERIKRWLDNRELMSHAHTSMHEIKFDDVTVIWAMLTGPKNQTNLTFTRCNYINRMWISRY